METPCYTMLRGGDKAIPPRDLGPAYPGLTSSPARANRSDLQHREQTFQIRRKRPEAISSAIRAPRTQAPFVPCCALSAVVPGASSARPGDREPMIVEKLLHTSKEISTSRFRTMRAAAASFLGTQHLELRLPVAKDVRFTRIVADLADGIVEPSRRYVLTRSPPGQRFVACLQIPCQQFPDRHGGAPSRRRESRAPVPAMGSSTRDAAPDRPASGHPPHTEPSRVRSSGPERTRRRSRGVPHRGSSASRSADPRSLHGSSRPRKSILDRIGLFLPARSTRSRGFRDARRDLRRPPSSSGMLRNGYSDRRRALLTSLVAIARMRPGRGAPTTGGMGTSRTGDLTSDVWPLERATG